MLVGQGGDEPRGFAGVGAAAAGGAPPHRAAGAPRQRRRHASGERRLVRGRADPRHGRFADHQQPQRRLRARDGPFRGAGGVGEARRAAADALALHEQQGENRKRRRGDDPVPQIEHAVAAFH